MDNFDHEENTKSGIGGSHDTILMLFQNPSSTTTEENVLSIKPATHESKRTFSHVLDCQKLIKVRPSILFKEKT